MCFGSLRRMGTSFLCVLGCLHGSLAAQDTVWARNFIEELCSRKLAGRGYVNDGALKASALLEAQLQKAGALPWKGRYHHDFSISVNTIPEVAVRWDGRTMKPGIDVLADAASPSWKGSLSLRKWSWADTLYYPRGPWRSLGTVPAVPEAMLSHPIWGKRISALRAQHPVPVWVNLVPRLPAWGVAAETASRVVLWLREDKMQHDGRLEVNIEHHYRASQLCRNVLAYIPGTRQPDSLLMLTAHYDHLGRMGKAVFPGANDNASGVAMVLDLARDLAKNPLPYSVVVVFFAAEEAGLLGSAALIRDQILPLNRIRFLLNLDLMGTGEQGMTVVNASVFPREFQLLDSLNKQHRLLPSIQKRGKAANSDHYFFTEAGVPSFFGYLAGPRPAYHSTDDVPQTLTLHGYANTYTLYRMFLAQIAGTE
ncbi:MAG: hypothetical protein RLZZ370_1101 [Bacteroidota bacterium]